MTRSASWMLRMTTSPITVARQPSTIRARALGRGERARRVLELGDLARNVFALAGAAVSGIARQAGDRTGPLHGFEECVACLGGEMDAVDGQGGHPSILK
jgi:hypothetical protein